LDREARLESALSECRALRREAVETKRALGRALDVRDLLASAVRAMAPPPRWRRPLARAKPAVTALVLFGDAHIGAGTTTPSPSGVRRTISGA
jgi:hypothetical protein